jgi:hypothetical protein
VDLENLSFGGSINGLTGSNGLINTVTPEYFKTILSTFYKHTKIPKEFLGFLDLENAFARREAELKKS